MWGSLGCRGSGVRGGDFSRVVVKIGVPFWVPPYCIRDPKRDYNFDNHPYIITNNIVFCK